MDRSKLLQLRRRVLRSPESEIALRNRSSNRVFTIPPRSFTKLAAVLFLALAATSSVDRSFGQDGADDESWTPRKKLMKHLQEPVKLDSVRLRPPNGFERRKHPRAEIYKEAGIGVVVWNKEEGKGIPTLVVMTLPNSEKEAWNGEKLARGFRNSIVRNWKNVKSSKIKTGRLHGAAAVQTQFRGVTADGAEVAGFLVAFNDSQGTVAITCVAASNDKANEILPILMNSALTCRRIRKER